MPNILFSSLPVFWRHILLVNISSCCSEATEFDSTRHLCFTLNCRFSAAWSVDVITHELTNIKHGQWTTIRAAVAKIRLNQIQIVKKFDSELQLWGWMMIFFTNWTGSEWARQSLSITLTKNRLQQEMMLREWAMCWKLLVFFKKKMHINYI